MLTSQHSENYSMAHADKLIERRLIKLRLSGPELSHSRLNNLEAVKRLVNGDPYATFGIRQVVEHVQTENLQPEDVLRMLAGYTKCSQDINYTQGRGYISPSSTIKGLKATANAIRKVAGGGRYVTPTLGEKLALELEDNRGKPLHETLSDREYQVMWMIASGKTVRQIADELFLSPNTVSTHRTRILRKMNMKSNAELMHYAIAHHLVD